MSSSAGFHRSPSDASAQLATSTSGACSSSSASLNDLNVHELVDRIRQVLAKQEKTMRDLNTKLALLTTTRSAVGLGKGSTIDRAASFSAAYGLSASMSASAHHGDGSAPIFVKLPFLSGEGSRATSPPSASASSTGGEVKMTHNVHPGVVPPEPPVVVRPAVHKVRPMMRVVSQDDVLSSTTETSTTAAPAAIPRTSSNMKGTERRGSSAASPLGRRSVPLSARGAVSRKVKAQTQLVTAAKSVIRTAAAPSPAGNSAAKVGVARPRTSTSTSSTQQQPAAAAAKPTASLTRSATAPRAASIKRSIEREDNSGVAAAPPRRVSGGAATATQARHAAKAGATNQKAPPLLKVGATRHQHSSDWDHNQRMKELEDIQATNTQALERTHSAPYARTHSMKSRTAESSPSRPNGSKQIGPAPQFATLEEMQAAATPVGEEGSGGDAQEPMPISKSRRGSTAGSNASGSSRKLTALRLAAKSPRVRGFGARLGQAFVAMQQQQVSAAEMVEEYAARTEAVVEPRKRVVVHTDPNREVTPAAQSRDGVGFTLHRPQAHPSISKTAGTSGKQPSSSPSVSLAISQTTSPLPPPRGTQPGKRLASASASRPPWSTTTRVAVADPQPLARSERRADGVEARNIVQVKKGHRKAQ